MGILEASFLGDVASTRALHTRCGVGVAGGVSRSMHRRLRGVSVRDGVWIVGVVVGVGIWRRGVSGGSAGCSSAWSLRSTQTSLVASSEGASDGARSRSDTTLHRARVRMAMALSFIHI